ncbi:MAG: N-6 DNA methylase [Flavobacteriaceae bacterium]|jgi:adenine-specific DNA-methyltransferase|nr:N-6 DNA methylase [Flavobacteriaceae bacterium]MBT7623640.1 N-6 DNA methylase [Flavobacteriaceae bacterium]
MPKKSTVSQEVIKNKKDYSTAIIISSYIMLYIEINEIDKKLLSKLNECNKYSNNENETLLDAAKLKFKKFNLKNLESVFENIIDLDRKKEEGAVYTPNYIIDYIIDYSLSIYRNKGVPIICDPACGSGGFLVRSINALKNKFNLSIEEAVSHIRGVDINSQSVSCAKILIELYGLSHNIILTNLDKNIICSDTLLTNSDTLLKQLNTKDGIDILVTNPPFVKLQNISINVREQLINKYPQFTNGSFSFSMLFLIAGKKLLSNRGVLGYITQNNMFTSLASREIRKFLQKERSIHTVIDFLHTKVFENASAYTCLLFLTNNQENKNFKFKWAFNPKADLKDSQFSDIEIDELNSKKWRLAPKRHLRNINNIENIGYKLGEVADIKVGFATLKDSIFLLDKGIDVEDDIFVPAIKIADIDCEEAIKANQRRLLFPYKEINGKFVIYSEEEMMSNFPKTYKYLLSKKDILATRSGSSSLKYFYEWGREQGMKPVSGKLLTKTFSSKPNFILDKSNSRFCNGYSVKPKFFRTTDSKIDIEILQKILNSSVMNYYSKLTSFQIDGNYQCFQKNFIELFNVPKLSNNHVKKIKELDDKLLDLFLCGLYEIEYDEMLEVINR